LGIQFNDTGHTAGKKPTIRLKNPNHYFPALEVIQFSFIALKASI